MTIVLIVYKKLDTRIQILQPPGNEILQPPGNEILQPPGNEYVQIDKPIDGSTNDK